VEPDRSYQVRDLDAGTAATHRGSALIAGLPVRIESNRPLRLAVGRAP